MADSIPNELYFLKDFVTEDIISVSFGDCWLYFYKETLIGVRHIPTKVSYFMDVKTKADTKANMAPTLDNLTEAHIKEAVDEIDPNAETTHLLPMTDLGGKALELAALELSTLLDSRLAGNH